MKFFIDTANIDEIKQGLDIGMVDGVTTNPSLIAKEKRPFEEILKDIWTLVNGPISAEVTSTDSESMVDEAIRLKNLHPNIVIKIPMGMEGLKAVKILNAKFIKTNVTLVFSATQALMAAKAGASYVSPFVGRLDDLAQHGMKLVEAIMTIYRNYGIETEVIVASVRSPVHVLESALIGAHISTIPLKVMLQLADHPLTERGVNQFMADWENREIQINKKEETNEEINNRSIV